MADRKFIVKASMFISSDKKYSIWFTIEQKDSGRIRITFLEETPNHHLQSYMLLHMINYTFDTLKLNFPQGLPDAIWHMIKGKKNTRFLEVKSKWYRIDNEVQGYWLNNSALLSMAKYFKEMPEQKVKDKVFVKNKKTYQILNPACSPNWIISYHELA